MVSLRNHGQDPKIVKKGILHMKTSVKLITKKNIRLINLRKRELFPWK